MPLDPRTYTQLVDALRRLDPHAARLYAAAESDAERSECYVQLLAEVRELEAQAVPR